MIASAESDAGDRSIAMLMWTVVMVMETVMMKTTTMMVILTMQILIMLLLAMMCVRKGRWRGRDSEGRGKVRLGRQASE